MAAQAGRAARPLIADQKRKDEEPLAPAAFRAVGAEPALLENGERGRMFFGARNAKAFSGGVADVRNVRQKRCCDTATFVCFDERGGANGVGWRGIRRAARRSWHPEDAQKGGGREVYRREKPEEIRFGRGGSEWERGRCQ